MQQNHGRATRLRPGSGSALTLSTVLLIGFASCNGPTDVIREPNPDGGETVLIVDQTGKRWDVSHGVSALGLDPDRFQYGLGPFAIQPIIDPEMIAPGDARHPGASSTVAVIGVENQGDVRAYPISILRRHEIIDDEIGDEPLAVGY